MTGTSAPSTVGMWISLILEAASCVIGHGHVRCAKIDKPSRDLADAAAGTDGLIVDLHAGMSRGILAKPLGIDRIGESCARPGQLLGLCGARGQYQQHNATAMSFSRRSPCSIPAVSDSLRPMLMGFELSPVCSKFLSRPPAGRTSGGKVHSPPQDLSHVQKRSASRP